MYSDNGVIYLGTVKDMNPDIYGKKITFTDGGGIKHCLYITEVIRLMECIKHDCNRKGMDYDRYEASLFDQER